MKELKYLNKFFLKYRNKIIIGILITIIARIFALVAPNLVGDSITLIEKYFLENSINENLLKEKLLINIFLIIGSAFVAGIFTFLMRQTLINVSRYIEFDLKNEIYNKYQELDQKFYKNNRTGDLMNRISEDVSKVRMYVGPALMYTINTIALFIIIISYMISVAPALTAYTIIPLPILSFLIFKLSKKINIKSKKVQESLSRITTYTQESFSGISVIKSNTIGKIKKIKSLVRSCNNLSSQIFMETPFRNDSLLNDLITYCNEDLMLCIACSISTSDEYIKTLPIRKWKKNKPSLNKKPVIFILGKN